MKQEDIYYEAMLARDARFDGKFFVGVKTTGIYCRPICPAKPKRENVEFFSHQTAAEQAGYRPCLRCRPESLPHSPAWNGKSALVQKAMKILYSPEMLEFQEEEFARLVGLSARHLRRLFLEEMGKTPKQLAFENRLHIAQILVRETSLPLTEVAFASGFGSIRRFNDAFKERFLKNPTEMRVNKSNCCNVIKIPLCYRAPFDFINLLSFYQTHQIGNLEWFEEGKMCRVVEFEGKVGQIVLSQDPKQPRIWVEIEFPDSSFLPHIIAKVRSFLDLDSDPLLIANALENDPKIKVLLNKYPGTRLPSSWEGFEVGVSTILGQFVSMERARDLVAQLIELVGIDSGLSRNGVPIKLFPKPEQLAEADLSKLKTTAARKQAVKDFARAVAEKALSLEPTQDVDEFVKKVTTIRGVGKWTANYMALKVLRHTDAFPETDLILARALQLHPKEAIMAMSPWRGYVAILLWREYAGILKKEKGKKT